MSIFRTIKKIRDCDICAGTGTEQSGDKCAVCEGTGKVEVYSRVSQAAASRAVTATKELPPQQRAAAKKRLKDHEETLPAADQALPSKGGDAKLDKSGFIDEDA